MYSSLIIITITIIFITITINIIIIITTTTIILIVITIMITMTIMFRKAKMPLWVSIENVASGLYVAISSRENGAQLHLEVSKMMLMVTMMMITMTMMMMIMIPSPRTRLTARRSSCGTTKKLSKREFSETRPDLSPI